MTGQEFFEQSMLLVIKCFIYALPFGLAIRLFIAGMRR